MHSLLSGDVISGNIAFNGFYELELSQRIVHLARQGTVFVDVGANMGYFSLLWAGINPSGRVIAFEAAPRNIEGTSNNSVFSDFHIEGLVACKSLARLGVCLS